MKLKKYVWVVEWLAVVLLLTLAIFSVVKEEMYLYIFGLLFVVFGLFRIVPLVKTMDSKLMKTCVIVETIVDFVSGILLILSAIYDWSFIKETKLLGIIIGGVIYLRGFIYFLGTTLKDEPSEVVGFFTNIIFITLATVIITSGGFNNKVLSWILFGVIFIIVIIFALKGYKDFRNYRGQLVGESKIKKVKSKEKKENKIDENTVIMPSNDEVKDTVINEKEEVNLPKDNL